MSFTSTCLCEMLSKELKEVLIVSNALNTYMSKESKVYSTLYTEPLVPPGGKAYCSCQSCGFNSSPV